MISVEGISWRNTEFLNVLTSHDDCYFRLGRSSQVIKQVPGGKVYAGEQSGDMVAGRVARDMPDRGGLLTISWSLGSDKKVLKKSLATPIGNDIGHFKHTRCRGRHKTLRDFSPLDGARGNLAIASTSPRVTGPWGGNKVDTVWEPHACPGREQKSWRGNICPSMTPR